MSKSLTFLEIDIPYCSLTYGVAPCTAALGVTGDIKCFNSLNTCQDRPNFSDLDEPGDSPRVPTTLRFAIDTDYLPDEIDCLPYIKQVDFTPAIVSLGFDLGQRATLKVTLQDRPHSDTGPGFDKYLADRDYDPWSQGTFFGKFRARHPFLRRRAIRLIRGVLGDALADMETRHFIIESFDGPTPDGIYTLIGKDVLKLADGDRAQAPVLSNGFLLTAITAIEATCTLSPSGIGNAEYPASGFAAIGGKEIVAFTRSGDGVFITRASGNTVAVAHDAGDRFQLCLVFSPNDPAFIITFLLTVYAGVSVDYISLDNWQDECDNFLGVLYGGIIAEPTSVAKLVSELIEQAALAVWWDDINQQLRLQVLRSIVTTADRFTPDNYIADSLGFKDQPEKRISQVWTYFGKINSLIKEDQIDNYRSTAIIVDADAEEDYGSPAIKKIFSRWIQAGGRSIADRVNEIQLSRYRDPPRRFTFDLMRYAGQEPTLGGGYRIEGWPFQDATGALTDAPFQITRLNPEADRYEIEGEEMLSTAADPDPTDRVIIFDSGFLNVDLRVVHDSIYPAPQSGDSITAIVQDGVIIGSVSTGLRAFEVGTWPAGVTITLIVRGRIAGRGGAGGQASEGLGPGSDGQLGGIALFTRQAITLEVPGAIWGGGGGGGGGGASLDNNRFGGGGGGGAGSDVGLAGGSNTSPGSQGTPTAGGAGGGSGGAISGGAGGGPGLSGADGTDGVGSESLLGGNGALAGAAIDGISFVTITVGPGDRRGSEVN